MRSSLPLLLAFGLGAAAALSSSAAAAQLPCGVERALGERTHSLVAVAAQRLTGDADLETGAAGDLLVEEFTEAACVVSGAGTWLPATCAPLTGGHALVELRRRVVIDVARLPVAAVQERLATLPPDIALRAALAVSVLEVALRRPALDELAQALLTSGVSVGPCAGAAPRAARLAGSPGGGGSAGRWVARGADAARPALPRGPALARQGDGAAGGAAPITPWSVAGRVLARLLALAPLGGPVDDRHRAAVAEELVAAGRATAGQALSPARERALGALLSAARALEAQRPGLEASDPGTRRAAILASMLELIAAGEAVASLVEDRAVTLPPVLGELLRALADVALGRGVTLAFDLVRALGVPAPALPEDVGIRLDQAARLVVARDRAEAERILRGIVLGLGPWSDPLLVDAGLVFPSVGDEVKVGGEGLLGYSGHHWGIAAYGSGSYYDLTSTQVVASTIHYGGGGDVWLSLGDQPLRVDLRLGGESTLYDTDLIVLGRDFSFTSETSLMVRGSGMVGARWEPGETFAGGLWAGAGMQYEFYDPLRVSGDAISLTDQETLSLLLRARLRAQVVLLRSWLALRVEGDLKRYGITRDALAVTITGGDVQTTAESQESTQLEVVARGYLDAEVLRFAGFVPGVVGGLDLYSLASTGQPGVTTTVPVFGVGVRRTSY